MHVAMLGGTAFLGRHVVERLLERGHTATLFNRGKRDPDLFTGRCETVVGDRATDIARLGDRTFDAVVDTSAYLPGVARASAEFLKPHAQRYLFVSSISVYEPHARSIDEATPRARLPAGVPDDVLDLAYYGALKALCEDAVVATFGPERSILVRPGLIVGPYDPSDRYTWWVERIARGGRTLAPAGPNEPTQYVDVRDLANWMVTLLETQASGAFNAISPPGSLTLGNVFEAMRAAAESDAAFVWAPESLLLEHGIEGWMDVPLWIPSTNDEPAFFMVDAARATATGLRTRPAFETARDTLAWLPERPDRPWKTGLSPEREAELLALVSADATKPGPRA